LTKYSKYATISFRKEGEMISYEKVNRIAKWMFYGSAISVITAGLSFIGYNVDEWRWIGAIALPIFFLFIAFLMILFTKKVFS